MPKTTLAQTARWMDQIANESEAIFPCWVGWPERGPFWAKVCLLMHGGFWDKQRSEASKAVGLFFVRNVPKFSLNRWIVESKNPCNHGFSTVPMLAQVTEAHLSEKWHSKLKMKSGSCAVLRSIAALLGWARQSTTFEVLNWLHAIVIRLFVYATWWQMFLQLENRWF